MKRTWFALAALAAAGSAAQAQAPASSVTMYGLIDESVEHLDNVGSDHAGLTRMPGLTGTLPSRLGFRGSEDLGGGLRALFTLESGLSLANGGLNQGGRMFGRQSFVGLSGAWGTLTFGRQYTMLFWSQLDADILGPAMFGSGSLDSYLPNARADSSLGWPGSFGSWSFGATYSLGRDAVNAGPTPAGTNCPGQLAGDAQACREASLMAKFDREAWGVAAAVDQIRGGPGAFAGLTSSALKDRRSTLDGWVRFDAWKLGAGLISRKNDASATTPRSDLWYLGAAYSIDPLFTIDGELFKLDYKNSANGATLAALRATYGLSRRTAVYATVGHVANDGTLALSVSNAAAGGTPVAGGSQSGLAVGMRHSF